MNIHGSEWPLLRTEAASSWDFHLSGVAVIAGKVTETAVLRLAVTAEPRLEFTLRRPGLAFELNGERRTRHRSCVAIYSPALAALLAVDDRVFRDLHERR
jgi:hypothetical protein